MYRLVLRAQFENQEELQRATAGLEQLKVQGANVSVTMGNAGTAGKASLEGIARSAMSVGFMYNMLESAMMRAQMAAMLLDSAQERYNNTVAKYGRNSKEAMQAMKELEQRTEYLNQANRRELVSSALMWTNIALQMGVLRSATAAKIAHTIAVHAATTAHWLENAALAVKAKLMAMVSVGTLVPAMLVGAAAVGIAASAYGAYQANQPQPPPGETQVDVQVTDEDIIRDYMRRVGGNSIKGTG